MHTQTLLHTYLHDLRQVCLLQVHVIFILHTDKVEYNVPHRLRTQWMGHTHCLYLTLVDYRKCW